MRNSRSSALTRWTTFLVYIGGDGDDDATSTTWEVVVVLCVGRTIMLVVVDYKVYGTASALFTGT